MTLEEARKETTLRLEGYGYIPDGLVDALLSERRLADAEIARLERERDIVVMANEDAADEIVSLKEALSCEECGGTGTVKSPLAVLDKPCLACNSVRKSIKRSGAV